MYKENALTGCFSIVEQELITKPSPELPLLIEDIVVCDEDYDEITKKLLPQRILFGKDSYNKEEFYTYFRVLESRVFLQS